MLTCGSLFSGIGLLDYGLHLAGWEHRWLCEWDPWRRSILRQRWPDARVHDDVRHIGSNNAESVVLLAGGFPCKGASTAGKRNGFDHPETVLWREMFRAIGELEPRYVLIENVANLLSLNGGAVWGEVLGDLASLGFDAVWDVLPAAAFGAPHLRERVFAVATHADRYAVRPQQEPEPGRRGPALAGEPGAAAADATIVAKREPRHEAESVPGGGEARPVPRGGGHASAADGTEPAEPLRHAGRLGVPVEWGIYGPAIRRWEALVGAAPEPLCAFRGVDARRARELERRRLSALGDGVQVQAGLTVGSYIADLERRRVSDAAFAA